MSVLTETERMLIRAAVDADETGDGDNDTSNLFATVEMILARRLGPVVDNVRIVPGGMIGTMSDPYDRTRGCPCRSENGGSGVCGCILGGPRVTC